MSNGVRGAAWFDFEANSHLNRMGGMMNWSEFWASACHSLWYWRNKMTHDGGSVLPNKPWLKVLQRAHVELFFGQELGNISSYAPSEVPTEHTTSSLSVKA
ncbi:hypothetical protein MTR_7g081605 [Medicago truncatula]|uniref:Uncharacterized protein n=1 Tax=Medicago truncatula TaxID=3880 RepID=A0A072U213_MEDTR|nr:hypothetical protein MTR_7g081605 [Medicago truncatula]